MTDVLTSDQKNKDYAKQRSDADIAVKAYQNASAEDKAAGKVASPTAQQWILNSGGGLPPQKDQLASQTVADIGVMGSDAAKRRAAQLQSTQNAAQRAPAPGVQPIAGGGRLFGGGGLFQPPGQVQN